MELPKMPSMGKKNKEQAPKVEGEGLDVPLHTEDLTGANGLSKTADAMMNPEDRDPEDDGFVKPGYENPEKGARSKVMAAPSGQKGIEVVAMRKGFYNQQRYEVGDTFKIRNTEDFGEWMKALDPSQEKKRVEMFRKKKLDARRKTRGDEE